mmetsp:Transcript_21473/g.43445  ORF Transcript_21473/g.43445 Transcript_21473/m.43445 type:complete len:111 (+) Transcript_21473:158-490(+)
MAPTARGDFLVSWEPQLFAELPPHTRDCLEVSVAGAVLQLGAGGDATVHSSTAFGLGAPAFGTLRAGGALCEAWLRGRPLTCVLDVALQFMGHDQQVRLAPLATSASISR